MNYYRRRRPHPMPTMRTICIRIQHDRFTHAIVSVTRFMVRVNYGVIRREFQPLRILSYNIIDNPELKPLWDGHGFDLKLLLEFVRKTTPDY